MRRCREDTDGALHHVVGRGIAKRAIFQRRGEARFFQSRMARVVRTGLIEVLAFALLTDHYHLLVRSVDARLGVAMARILGPYTRYFNRCNGRDGPLFRSRFYSRRVEGASDFRTVVRYIDRNPVEAHLCSSPGAYEFGSARHYAARGGPIWLARSDLEVEVKVEKASGSPIYDPGVYPRVFGEPLDEDEVWLVERRVEHGRAADPIAAVLGEPSKVREQMLAAARNADGRETGHPHAAPGPVDRGVAAARRGAPRWDPCDRARAADGWAIVRAGLLRCICGLSHREISARLGVSVRTVGRLLAWHQRLLESDSAYATRIAEVLPRICLL